MSRLLAQANFYSLRRRVAVPLACTLLGLASLAAAQGMPTFTGKKEITQAVNTDTGAIFELSGATLTFPIGLPVGRSRLVTLKQGKRPAPGQVGKGFSPLGPTLDFNGAFSTGSKPIRVAVASKKNPEKKGQRLVLAMEIQTLCDDSNRQYKLSSGLCSGWQLIDASFRGNEVVAEVTSTGGLRMQFGTAPEAEDAE